MNQNGSVKSLRVVLASEEHIHSIAALERASFSRPWSEQSVRSELENPLACLFIALIGKTVAGYIGIQKIVDECNITNLAVEQSLRRQGVGSALLRAAEADARVAQCSFMTLEVRAGNESARKLYAGHGFYLAGRRKNYYEEPVEDALIMTKYFNQV